MIRIALVNCKSRDIVHAAARKLGLECRFAAYSASHVERLKHPALLIFDTDAVDLLTPEHLQALRRTHVTGVRHSPVVALCRSRGEASAWRNAGAVAALRSSNADTLGRAIREALAGADDWVTSKGYVGPSRRKRKPILRLKARRTEDRDKPQTQSDAPVASLGVIQRRLYLGAALLTGSSLENRRAFDALADELRQAAILQHRPDLAALVRAIGEESRAFVEDGQRTTAVLEGLIADLSVRL